MPAPYSVLFVCTGNTCRSPMAEHVLRQDLADAGLAADVASAGLRVEAEGRPADLRAQEVLRANGYGSDHATRQFEPAMFAVYDLVIGMTSMHVWVLRSAATDGGAGARIRLLGSFDPGSGAGWDVPDPVTGDLGDYQRVLGLLRSAMPGVVAEIRSGIAATGR